MTTCPLVAALDPTLDEREAKFLPGAAAVRAFWVAAARHLRPQGDAPFTYARTTYFDTAELAYYHSHGVRVRVREYAVATRADEVPVVGDGCYLELKQSVGGRRTKLRIALRPEQLDTALGELVDASLTPQVATWYRRRALVDGAGQIRVTLDDRIVFCRPRPLGSAFGQAEVVGDGPPFVLEYKARVAPPRWLVLALGGIREVIDFSKFDLAMESVRPDAGRLTVSAGTARARTVASCTG